MRYITFGEIMLRLKSPGHERLLQTPALEATFGGSEANVAVSLANYGEAAALCTVLPRNKLGDACIRELRKFNVDTGAVFRGDGRMGLYFLEGGANQLPSGVIYDRAFSALAIMPPGSIDWTSVLQGYGWFHTTGITPAVSESAMELALESVKAARSLGLTVSLDLNYRKNLWKYGSTAVDVMKEMAAYADIIIANEEDCQMALGVQSEVDIQSGAMEIERFKEIGETVLAWYPQLKKIAITLRESKSADMNGWAACLNDREKFYISRKYEIRDIVDRVGVGDSFVAGLIYGLNHYCDPQVALEFATATSCLKHSIMGDFHLIGLDDVLSLMKGNESGRVQR